jgi:hypothetical protein
MEGMTSLSGVQEVKLAKNKEGRLSSNHGDGDGQVITIIVHKIRTSC